MFCGVNRSMAQACDKPLKGNPFLAHRDPETGQWRVLQDSRGMLSTTSSVKSQVPATARR